MENIVKYKYKLIGGDYCHNSTYDNKKVFGSRISPDPLNANHANDYEKLLQSNLIFIKKYYPEAKITNIHIYDSEDGTKWLYLETDIYNGT